MRKRSYINRKINKQLKFEPSWATGILADKALTGVEQYIADKSITVDGSLSLNALLGNGHNSLFIFNYS